jgi:TonB family protein
MPVADQKIRRSDDQKIEMHAAENYRDSLLFLVVRQTVLVVCIAICSTNLHCQDSGDERIVKEFYMTRSVKKYPTQASNSGVEGIVVLELTVDTLCRIISKSVLDGPDHGLHQATLDLVDRKFEQSLISSLKYCVPGTIQIPVRFQLTR